MLPTTTGSRSGKERTNPVLCVTEGDDLVTVASAEGAPNSQAWFTNLIHHPEATVTIGRKKRKVVGRKATPEEGSRLWPKMTVLYTAYDSYAEKTGRETPMVVLSPAS